MNDQSATATLAPAQARAIAKEAVIYGFPLVDNVIIRYSLSICIPLTLPMSEVARPVTIRANSFLRGRAGGGLNRHQLDGG
jgi:hypothetical protein